jgi:large subunit ribosomal protein L31
MKKDLHPSDYRPVVFRDDAADFSFLTQSTAQTDETIVWEDGNTYPLVKVMISSASHPFFTGEEKIIDTEGRVDRFKARFEAAKSHREAQAKKSAKPAKKAPVKKPIVKEEKEESSEE